MDRSWKGALPTVLFVRLLEEGGLSCGRGGVQLFVSGAQLQILPQCNLEIRPLPVPFARELSDFAGIEHDNRQMRETPMRCLILSNTNVRHRCKNVFVERHGSSLAALHDHTVNTRTVAEWVELRSRWFMIDVWHCQTPHPPRFALHAKSTTNSARLGSCDGMDLDHLEHTSFAWTAGSTAPRPWSVRLMAIWG